MKSNQSSVPNINNVFSLFSEGAKLALYEEKPFLDADICPDIEQRHVSSLSSISSKYDVLILDNLGKTSELVKLLDNATEGGCAVVLLKNKTFKEKLCIALRIISLHLCAKKWQLKFRGYFLLPEETNPTQVVSCQRYLAQQYFHKYYHWQYNEESKKMKRLFKHLMYMFNAFYLNENYFLFWISKNAK
ncbi:hypothetical protein CC99x_009425 [Candidatus Berkiella cookevillensis]|uniref:Uncharacterized protein n=1 Tax=Candidatus Berkiella cookevillensis TaxID=437022 RepID=A0A0Q9YBD1_9GAMM|nr:hypothetical protein [Candidatus Berkiella cookevillensis]MCS5709124.1 hypothetical protein [Candidatus Berkiella cookevillensis]